MELTFTQCKQLIENGYDIREVVERLSDQPGWITCHSDFEISDIQGIQEGGCASGACMPAVTYHRANEVMKEYGDEVLEYIYKSDAEFTIPEGVSWSQLASHCLSMAIELWCWQFDLDGVNWD